MPLFASVQIKALMVLITTRPVPTHMPGITLLAYTCRDATCKQMAMLNEVTDRCAEDTFRSYIAAFQRNKSGPGDDEMLLLMPQSDYTGHLAFLKDSDKLLGGKAASALLICALGERRVVNAVATMAFSAETGGETHFNNVALLLDAIAGSVLSSLPHSTKTLRKKRGGYGSCLIQPANEGQSLWVVVDARRAKCRRMIDALKSIEDATSTDRTACVVVVAGTDGLRRHMELRLPPPAQQGSSAGATSATAGAGCATASAAACSRRAGCATGTDAADPCAATAASGCAAASAWCWQSVLAPADQQPQAEAFSCEGCPGCLQRAKWCGKAYSACCA